VLVQMALAFVLEHPAVTAAIIGPRTLDQLETQLGAADVRLDGNCSTASTRSSRRGRHSIRSSGWTPPSLASAELRRRSLS